MAITTLVSGAGPVMPTIPQVAPMPGPTDPSTFADKAWTTQQLGSLSGVYDPQRTAAAGTVKAGLAGYGGYGVDAAGNVSFDSAAGPGQLEKGAIASVRAGANARGMLYSSFANQGVSAALNRLSETARAVVNHYAADIAGINAAQTGQYGNLTGHLMGLYGQDAAFAIANPPAVTAPEAPAAPPDTQSIRAQAGLPPGDPTYTSPLAQKYGGIYGAIGSDPKQQQNIIDSWLKSHYGPKIEGGLIKRASTDQAYASRIYNMAMGGK